MLPRSAISRYVLSLAIVVGTSATATVVTAHNDGFNERMVVCLESRDPNSDECASALAISPVGADFFAQLATNLTLHPATKPEPTSKPDVDTWTLLKACAETRNLDSDECREAMEATGLSADELKAKLNAKFGCVFAMNQDGQRKPCEKKDPACATAANYGGERKPCAKKDETTKKPEPKKPEAQPLTGSLKKCLDLRAKINGMSVTELHEQAEQLRELCGKALRESNLSVAEFWAKPR
jgi:hypothetical protein